MLDSFFLLLHIYLFPFLVQCLLAPMAQVSGFFQCHSNIKSDSILLKHSLLITWLYSHVIVISTNSSHSLMTLLGVQLFLQSLRVHQSQCTLWPLLPTGWEQLFFPQLFGMGRCHQKNYSHRLTFHDMIFFPFSNMRF